ncbi:putative prolyl 4-hydroxylase 9 [Dorcoceras hygrometricum]|uniref:Putative prolyl 4-hydroxylase 9 n=1 Tax=Dorcoceras hygrometricum TaxID=472368 RepID=A0A2Z7AJP1_9LAMI|nr:putative prolyl 4-hydroxylase 9 [Dorcoceras hygrometricum]
MTMSFDTMSFSNQTRNWKSVDRLLYLLVIQSREQCDTVLIMKQEMLVVASAEEQENDIRTTTEDDQQQLRNLVIVIYFRSGGSISCLNTQHETWNSN